MIRRLRGGKQSVEYPPINDKNRKLPVGSTDRLVQWREYFSELLNVNASVDSQIIDQISVLVVSTEEKHRQEKLPFLQELQLTLKQMKNRKAPSNDDFKSWWSFT
ncbi:unnamed protein product [Didymodactylos carnosus]|uniref:Uncharacterized protein n=1 Tax=Didymodactylos carnosus TaxID=1234261 RepID=A0A816BD05_9BILA|nr:unnamed protein product [Didymodactylos carnosus]CAF1606105.1 unnamed protein product [Didymodactylos carnosus]CAF4284405.1 unnamed protein product [Didymodactylos carnosus]CAF4486077.1 unnamed protein product [Didymodactylos carnosus]